MRICCPVSRSDLSLLPDWVDIAIHLRCGSQHALHFVVPNSLQSEVMDAKARLEEAGTFESVQCHVLDMEPMGGWPIAPNNFFYHCAFFMEKENPTLPWQLVELDCRPLRQNSFDAVAAKYASCGNPFFGSVDKTPWRETIPYLLDERGNQTAIPNPKFGKITKSIYGDADLMMSGCGVYPGNMLTRPNLSGLMMDFMKGGDSIEQPWDMHLRAAMQAEGMAHTDLIAQHWNTENYRIEDGQIVCDARDTHEMMLQNPNWEIRKCGGIVNPSAALIHGCKDDSLTKLILSNSIPDVIVRTAKATVVVPALAASTTAINKPDPNPTIHPVSDPRVDALQAQMNQMMGLLTQLVPKATETKTEPPLQTVLTPTPYDSALIEKVYGVLSTVGAKQMLSSIAKTISADKKDLKSAISGSGKFKISGPAEWVERIAA